LIPRVLFVSTRVKRGCGYLDSLAARAWSGWCLWFSHLFLYISFSNAAPSAWCLLRARTIRLTIPHHRIEVLSYAPLKRGITHALPQNLLKLS
jgi:hypothetical protein